MLRWVPTYVNLLCDGHDRGVLWHCHKIQDLADGLIRFLHDFFPRNLPQRALNLIQIKHGRNLLQRSSSWGLARRALACDVRFYMPIALDLCHESHTTNITYVNAGFFWGPHLRLRLAYDMNFHMPIAVTLRNESYPANITYEVFFTAVSLHVNGQVALL